MSERAFYNNPKLSEEQLIQVFSDAWVLADTTVINEQDKLSCGGRIKVEMSLKDFVYWLKRCAEFRSFSFADKPVAVGGARMFTAFVTFTDPVIKRELFGWAHVPMSKAQSLIHRYGLMRC
ncbi:MAG: hypothetical protein IK089_06475 [Oxalobacter sp.]|jgi:hypothetical protein|nr:hypothetical protein [Oxalobacter sp.]MBR6000882.1 hypothetical protein [Oxalobacter sp.]